MHAITSYYLDCRPPNQFSTVCQVEMHANDGVDWILSQAENLSGLSGDVAAAGGGTSTICRCSSCSHSSSLRQDGSIPMLTMMWNSKSIKLVDPDRGVMANKILGPGHQPERWFLVTRLKSKDKVIVSRYQKQGRAQKASNNQPSPPMNGVRCEDKWLEPTFSTRYLSFCCRRF